MLKPSMNELMARVNNRYLLVNLAAQRARDLAEEYETTGRKIPDKSVKLALDEIADGVVVYRDGPRPEPEPKPEPVPESEAELGAESQPTVLEEEPPLMEEAAEPGDSNLLLFPFSGGHSPLPEEP